MPLQSSCEKSDENVEIATHCGWHFFQEEIMNLYMYWPILLAVGSDVVYQIAAKGTPQNLNPFASMTITYLIAAAASAAVPGKRQR